MKLVREENFLSSEQLVIEEILAGKIFIYPTDTIYGLGCDATNESAVSIIRGIKQRKEKPLSIIAPSKKWILENCELADLKALEKLPGPYTIILNLKNEEAVAPNVNPDNKTIGVRIPANWFTKIVEKAGVPFVTTSVNISGEKNMEKIEDISPSITEKIDYIIYEGEIKGSSSKKIGLTK